MKDDGRKYNLIMEQIHVTMEMEQRVMSNLEQALHKLAPPVKRHYLSSKYRWIAIVSLAACMMALVCITILLPNPSSPDHNPSQPPLTNVPAVTTYSSLEALGASLPFELKIPSKIPTEYKLETMHNLFGMSAELIYINTSSSGELRYRMAEGTDDISGDWNNYAEIKEIRGKDNQSITLKGTDDLYELAVWTDGKYAYSITVTEAVSEDTMMGWIASLVSYPELESK